MPKEKLINEQISYSKEKPLKAEEVQRLKDKVYRQIMLYLPGYLLLLTGALIIYLNAPASYKTVVNPHANLDDDDAGRMWKVAPYLSVFVVVMSTIFFGRIYYQGILPILKDLKHRSKIAVFYKPQKTAMAVFSRYYLSVPLFNKRQIQVEDNDFNLISESDDICLELGKNSMMVLGIKKGDKDIKYFESINR